jgi:uncharacterized protein
VTPLGRPARWAWLVVAYAAAGVALVAVAVPLLPTTPFALLAVFAAARGSARLHAYLLRHRVLGPLVSDWKAHRAVRRSAKGAATASMAVSAAVLFVVLPSPGAPALVTLLMAGVGAWLWSRPEPPEAGRRSSRGAG